MEHRYRYRTGLHIHPFPEVQPDVRSHRRSAAGSRPLASEHSVYSHCRVPLQDRSEVNHLISSMPHKHMNQRRK